MIRLSIVIPVLNDKAALVRLLPHLLNSLPAEASQIVVVDGGSSDGACVVAQQYGCSVEHTRASRGLQLQHGFLQTQGEWIWFLHADSMPDRETIAWLLQPREPCWGRFDVRFDSGALQFKVIATMMNWRSRRSGICTGDQGIFVHRSLLVAIGGVPPQALMEDIELSKRLKRMMKPLCPRLEIATSSRRWDRFGLVRTVLGMWWFRLRYWLGADPERLAGDYYS